MNDSQLTGTLNVTNTNEEPGQKDSIICCSEAKVTYLNYQGYFHSHFYYWEIKNLVEANIY